MELNAMAWARQKLLRERMELNAMARSTTGTLAKWPLAAGTASDIVSGTQALGHRFPSLQVKTWWQPGEDLVAA
jgi:hypothetical protein